MKNIKDTIIDKSIPSIEFYRVAANAKEKVTTQGFSIGVNYYINPKTAINGNYSWNKLINEKGKDPLIPAYNTPEYKFNIGGEKGVSGIKFKFFPFLLNIEN